MRIIGGRDYYDNGLAWGRDEAILFLRNGKETIELAQAEAFGHAKPSLPGRIRASDGKASSPFMFYLNPHLCQNFPYGDLEYDFQPLAVVFCGKRYSGVRVTCRQRYTLRSAEGIGTFHFWDTESYFDFLDERGLTTSFNENELNAHFMPAALTGAALDHILDARITLMSVIAGWRKDERIWLVDQPTLADIEFFRAIDPVTAFQEISMWVGGVIGNKASKTVEITDDKVKIQKHGFDVRSSFRKGKSTRQRNA